jgi:transposase
MGRRPIEKNRPELVGWLRDGMTNADAAKKLDVSAATIANARERLGIEREPARKRGRPSTGAAVTGRLVLVLTPDQKKRIAQRAKTAGVSMSAYVLSRVL